MKNNLILTAIIWNLLLFITYTPLVFCQTGALTAIEIPSSFNPVGSGARAIGRGGAFIAVADDATAASWNPGGLIQLKRKPEFSIVTSAFNRKEDNHVGINPDIAGENSIFDKNINYLSAAWSFEWLDRNMSLALTYQHLYDFNREWVFMFRKNSIDQSYQERWDYQQEGNLTALGLSYCIQIIPKLSIGVTLNYWKDGLTPNQWKQSYHVTSSGTFYGEPYNEKVDRIEDYSFKGFNFNIGLLYRINRKLAFGAVLKTPFSADMEHKIYQRADYVYPMSSYADMTDIQNSISHDTIQMPMSYGVGFVYNFTDSFSVSADIYRTEWGDFIYRDEHGYETSPVSGRPINKSDIDATHQVRIGAE